MNDKKLEPGSVVLCKMGRDKGGHFMVCGILDEDYVLICDGLSRRLQKPKKKNVKHVKEIGVVLDNIAAKLKTNKKVFDSEVRSALRQYNEQQNND